jgi:hypothetical protein
LQFALIDAHQQLQECYEVIEQMVVAEQVVANLNREQRRKLEKVQSKLILPK